MRLLLVEDDRMIGDSLRAALRMEGSAVDWVRDAQAAEATLRTERFDLVLLDLGLADGDGGSLLQRIRASAAGAGNAGRMLPDPMTPVLIMTARDQVADRISGLDQGADDYLTKPFDLDELEARMRALLRRASGRAHPLIRYSDLVVNPGARTVLRDGKPVELAPREFSLLLLMLESHGRVLSRQQIEERLYNWNDAVGSNAIEVHVHHLRRKLGEELIQTVRGVGYFVPQDDRA